MDYELKNIYFQLPIKTLPFSINLAISSFQLLLSVSQGSDYQKRINAVFDAYVRHQNR